MNVVWQPTSSEVPEQPGVYLFRNARGTILYVGKALNLRRRIASYFQRRARQPAKVRRLVARARGVTIHVTGSELEALLLESRLIKQAMPPFNRMSTDYSPLPFVKLTLADPFPRLLLTREFEADASHYLGPFSQWEAAEVALAALQRIFPLRSCETPIVPGVSPHPCPAFYVQKCVAPCVGKDSALAYGRHVADLLALLARGREAILQRLMEERQRAADAMLFERAAHLHALLIALDAATLGRPLALLPVAHRNVAVVFAGRHSNAHDIFFVRGGLFAGRSSLREHAQDLERLETLLADCYFPIHPSFVSGLTGGGTLSFPSPPDLPHSTLSGGEAVVDELRIVGGWLHRTQQRARWVFITPQMSLKDAVGAVVSAMAERQGRERSRCPQT